MGRNVADYTDVRASIFTIDVNAGDEERMNFRLRNEFLRDLKGIITFMIRNAEDLRLRIDINNNVITEDNIANGNFQRAYQEIFPMSATNLSPFGQGVLTFTALRGQGSFSDIVLWYRRDSD